MKEDCLFDLIYLKKEEASSGESTVASERIRLGRLLAKSCPREDHSIIVPVPETGNFFAQGYSLESKLPLVCAVFKKRPKPKTLFIEHRKEVIGDVFLVIPELVRNRKVILLDEVIISGTTLFIVIAKLKEAKVKEIHARIIAPMQRQCPKGYSPDTWKFIKSETAYAKYFQIDSFHFLDDGILKDFANCIYCFEKGQK